MSAANHRSTLSRRLAGVGGLAAAAVLSVPSSDAHAQGSDTDPVTVVIVDTSGSMGDAGYDPARASVLVTKLLSDVVPGELGVTRLLDFGRDRADLPGIVETSTEVECEELKGERCIQIQAPPPDVVDRWEAGAREKLLGIAARPMRGDSTFKQRIDAHLRSRSEGSLFFLAFRAAAGFIERNPTRGRRMVIWLSDGRAHEPNRTVRAIQELVASGADVVPVLFGAGDPGLAVAAGLQPSVVRSPLDMMRTFAALFRRIVDAPHELDARIADEPTFEMQPNVERAWVVVYGDRTLSDVKVAGPEGARRADHAHDELATAGAYRVAYLEHPRPGRWRVEAQGGGPEAAFAVVQWSNLTPAYLGPTEAVAEVPERLVAGIRAGADGPLVSSPELLGGLRLTAEVQGATLELRDDGRDADETAGDGRHSGWARFRSSDEKVPVVVRARSDLIDRTVRAEVAVRGTFSYQGGIVHVDLGRVSLAERACRTLAFDAVLRGRMAFALEALESPPAGHRLELELPAGKLEPGGDPVEVDRGPPWAVCLSVSSRAPSSEIRQQPMLEARVAGSSDPTHRVTVALSWQVAGMSWWMRYRELIIGVLVAILIAFLLAGWILPRRFPRGLAIAIAAERDELEEVSAQPVAQAVGSGIGFYRNARAYLLPYRIARRSSSAIAQLQQRGRGAAGLWIQPVGGAPLALENSDRTWETVPPEGRRARPGDIFRAAGGVFVRIAIRGFT